MWLSALALLFEYPSWWHHVDRVNEALLNANFETAIRNPWFLGVSAVVIIAGLLRAWKGLLVCYIGGIAMWGVVHHTVLKDQASAAESSGSVIVFSALVVIVAGVGIYFVLIRD